MGAERQGRHDAPVIGGEIGDHVVPERRVHHEAVQQDDRPPVAAGLPVVDRAGGQLDPAGHRGVLRGGLGVHG
jgi:hypothetical protein